MRGRKPANRHASAGSAEATSAASAADGPGQHLDLQPGRHAALHEHEPRVGDQRHAGVGDQRDDGAAPHPRDEIGGPLALVVLVVGDERRRDAVALEQHAGPARVLAGHDVRVAQRGQHAQRDVLEVPDRRRADDQAPVTPPRAARDSATMRRRSRDPPPRAPSAPRRSSPPARRTRPAPPAPRRARAPARAARISARAGPSSISPAAITPPPITMTSGLSMFTRLESPTPSARPTTSSASRATGSPSWASSVTNGPVSSRPSSSAWPSAVSGRRATRSAASRTSAEPEAITSRQPRFGQLPWHGGPSMSTTMWPSSAPAPIAAALQPPAQHEAAADAGAEREHHDVAKRRRRRRTGPRPARRSWRRCRRPRAGRAART